MSHTLELDLSIADEAWTALGDIDAIEALCQRALGAALAVKDTDGYVSVMFTGDDEMQALNAQWRGKDKPTDVLSFPADRIEFPFLGDIAIGFGAASRDADAMKKHLEAHTAHLLIHGLFHLLGHDHELEADAAEMEALEVKALATLGLPDPYVLAID